MRQPPKTTEATEEHVQVLRPANPYAEGAVPQGSLSSNPSTVVADATTKNDRNAASKAAAAEVRYYRVVQGGAISDPTSKTRTVLRTGKEIDSRNYNVIELQRQGIKLERITKTDSIDESEFVQ